MTETNFTEIRPRLPVKRANRRKVTDARFNAIEGELHDCFCLISCAVAALGQAEDESDNNKAATAASVLRRGVEDLDKVRPDLDAWHLSLRRP
jgi:hypothetical protein